MIKNIKVKKRRSVLSELTKHNENGKTERGRGNSRARDDKRKKE